MKKRTKTLMCLCLCLLLFGFLGRAQEARAADIAHQGTVGDANLSWTLYSDGELRFDALNSGNAQIPSVGADKEWRAYKDQIKTVKIADTVSSIGGSAFSGCTSLTSLILTDNVNEIGAYGMCPADTRVYVPTPAGNAAIAVSNAYQGGHNYYVIGDDSCSLRCSREGVITLRQYMGNEENVVLPAYVSILGEYAFSDNATMKTVTLTGVTKMDPRVFWNCTALETAVLNEGLPAISTQAFTGCANLHSVIIPDSVESISDSAFSSASDLCLNVGCISYARD